MRAFNRSIYLFTFLPGGRFKGAKQGRPVELNLPFYPFTFLLGGRFRGPFWGPLVPQLTFWIFYVFTWVYVPSKIRAFGISISLFSFLFGGKINLIVVQRCCTQKTFVKSISYLILNFKIITITYLIIVDFFWNLGRHPKF